MPALLTTGEFADFCGTTKDTLLHYDRKGLLKPYRIAANGYRQYVCEQFFEFDTISMLKETGSTLEEAKEFMAMTDEIKIRNRLLEKQKRLHEEILRLQRRSELLSNLLECSEHLSGLQRNTLRVESHDEIVIDVEQFETLTSFEDDAFVAGYARLINRYLDNASSPRMPFGIVVPLANAATGNGAAQSLFCLANASTDKFRTQKIPSGRYARYAYQGPDDGYERALAQFLTQCFDQGLTPTGNIYVFDLMGLASYPKEERCLLDFSVKVG